MNNSSTKSGYNNSKVTYALLLVLFCTALYLPTSFRRDLHGKDELRYAEVVREMRVNKNWLVPRFGWEYYSEKPPVYFSILNLSQSIFGKSTFSMVLPSILAGILGVLLIFLFGRRILKERYAFLAGLILATSGLYYGLAIFLRMDMLLSVLATAASVVFFEGYRQESERTQNRCYYSFYILMAIAILIKGPTGFLIPFITAIVFLVSKRQWSEFKKIKLLKGLGIVLGVIGLWALILILTGQKEYAYRLFVLQTLGRAVNSFSHKEPIYFYLKEFPVIILPWTIFLISQLVLLIANNKVIYAFGKDNPVLKWLFYGPKERIIQTDADRYLLCWLIAPFVLMSLFSGKLVIYLLPIVPAGALLVARLVELVDESKAKASYLTVPVVITLLLLFALIFVLPKETNDIPLRTLMRPAVVPYIILGIIAFYGLFRRKFQWVPLLIAGMFFLFFTVLTWNVLPKVSAGYTKKPIAMELKRLRENGVRDIVAYEYYQPESLGYYSDFIIKEIPPERISEYLKNHPDAVVLSEKKHLDEISTQFSVKVIHEANRDVLLKQNP